MNTIKFLTLFLISLTAFGFSSKKPVKVLPPIVTPPIKDAKAEVLSLVANNKCQSYSWKNRGKAPAGYSKGMGLLFAKNYCDLKLVKAPQMEMAKSQFGPSDRDALNYWGLKSDTPENNLVNLFTLATGLGLRESSGKLCVGVDQSSENYKNFVNHGTPFPGSGDGVEAGLFQTSWNARLTLTKELFNKYKSDGSKCLKEVFSEGASCSATNLKNFGSGDALAYQKLSKDCPAFHAEFTLVAMRSLRKHWGPINRKEVELNSDCKNLYSQIKTFIDSNPKTCEQF